MQFELGIFRTFVLMLLGQGGELLLGSPSSHPLSQGNDKLEYKQKTMIMYNSLCQTEVCVSNLVAGYP